MTGHHKVVLSAVFTLFKTSMRKHTNTLQWTETMFNVRVQFRTIFNWLTRLHKRDKWNGLHLNSTFLVFLTTWSFFTTQDSIYPFIHKWWGLLWGKVPPFSSGTHIHTHSQADESHAVCTSRGSKNPTFQYMDNQLSLLNNNCPRCKN